jgi:hypothetical protein
MKIPTKTRTKAKFDELGFLFYMLLHPVNAAGDFRQSLDTIADATGCSHATVGALEKRLIDNGAIIVVQKSVKDRLGHHTTPTLRPNLAAVMQKPDLGFMQKADLGHLVDSSGTNPSQKIADCDINRLGNPKSELTDNVLPILDSYQAVHIVKPIDTPPKTADISPPVYMGTDLGFEHKPDSTPSADYLPGQRGIPASEFDRRRIPWCSECRLERCDFFEHKGVVDIEQVCSEECEIARQEWEAAQAAAGRKQ